MAGRSGPMPWRHIALLVGVLILVALACALALGTVGHRLSTGLSQRGVGEISRARYETGAGEAGEIRLPGSLDDLAPRSPVTVYAEVDAAKGDHLLIKTVYTELRLYADDVLIYEVGQQGSYPAFLLDPPTIIAAVPLPAEGPPPSEGPLPAEGPPPSEGPLPAEGPPPSEGPPPEPGVHQLRFEYLSPSQRSVMSLPGVFVGEETALAYKVFRENAFSFLLSLLLILAGVAMAVMSLLMMRGVPNSSSFFWLGLFSLATGVWVFGECDLSALVVPRPSLLYMLAFIGMFTLAVPLLQYGLVVLNPRPCWPMRLISAVILHAAAAAFALQWLGLVSLSRSMYVFHTLLPITFLTFAGCLIWEAVRGNRRARYFAFPVLTLSASAILELINYRVRFTEMLSLPFQLGVLVFVLSLGMVGGRFAREAMRTEAERARLEMEVSVTARQLALQREQYDRLAGSIEATHKARHDLRHQLAVLKDYADRGDTSGLGAYLGQMIGSLPAQAEDRLCENYAVNAIAQHYLSIARRRGMRAEARLCVPEETEAVFATDLCVVFGNLLENAIEACDRMVGGDRFVRIRAELQGLYLVIATENSFDGLQRGEGGKFYSRKRAYAREGVGLSSVRAIAGKYGGYAEFGAADGVFEAAVVVRMQN